MNNKTFKLNLEVVKTGYANGVAPGFPFTEKEKWSMVDEAAEAYGKFLDALGCDWRNDPNSQDTPRRVAKAYVFDLWKGRYDAMSDITSFPSDGYDGIVIERNIPLISMCSHHHQTIGGVVHVGYIVGENGSVIGLSKLNRIVEWFSRRPQMQESLTQQIHDYLSTKMNCPSVAVSIACKHTCCSHRGIKHPSVMTTNKFSGVFMEKDNLIREEFLHAIEINGPEMK